MGQDRLPSQELGDSDVGDGQLMQTPGSHSTATPTESQWQLPSRQETTLLAGLDDLSFVSDTTRPWTAGELNDVSFEHGNMDMASSNFQYQSQLLFGEIESSQAPMAQAIQRWSPSQTSGIHVNYNANDEESIQIQGHDSTAATSFELQGQPEPRQEYLFRPFLTHSYESPYAPYTQAALFDANRPWTAEERDNMALWINFNADCNTNDQQSIQRELRQENLLRPGSSLDLPSTSYTSEQIPVIDPTRGWTADGRNNVVFEQDSPLSQDRTSFNFRRQFQFPFGENEYSQPANSRGLSRLLIPESSGAAGLPTGTSSTTTAPSAQSPVAMEPSAAWPLLTTEDDPRTVGSQRVQQAAARRRKKEAIYHCLVDNCTATFTEAHNLRYHQNAHMGLKPYRCNICTYAADSPATLQRHSKKLHQKVHVEP